MVQAALVEEKIQAGKWRVRVADRKKVPLRAALWEYSGERERWTLALEENTGARLDTLQFARSLREAVATMKNVKQLDAAKDLLVSDVRLFTRPHPLAQELRSTLGNAKSVSRTRLGNSTVGGQFVDGAVLYRLEPSQTL